MSNALAVAAVSALLKLLLEEETPDIKNPVNSSVVTVYNLKDLENHREPGLNLFLYHVAFNQGWRNHGMPSHDRSGYRMSNPPLALDLYYLLSATGVDPFDAEILLGYGMQVFHEMPLLLPEKINGMFGHATGNTLTHKEKYALVSQSGIADQVESIKIVPYQMSTDEMSRLWPALGSYCRPSAAYRVSVVLIENILATRQTLPVQSRSVYALPLSQPFIESLASQKDDNSPVVPYQPVLAGYNLVINGSGLGSDLATVTIGSMEFNRTAFVKMMGSRIALKIPEDGLRAGVQSVRVAHLALLGGKAHRIAESNVSAFVLCPKIVKPPSLTANTITGATAAGDLINDGYISIDVSPAIGKRQKISLLLNEYQPVSGGPGSNPPPARTYIFDYIPDQGSAAPDELTNLEIPFTNVIESLYLVRVRVDGAESPLFSSGVQLDSPVVDINDVPL